MPRSTNRIAVAYLPANRINRKFNDDVTRLLSFTLPCPVPPHWCSPVKHIISHSDGWVVTYKVLLGQCTGFFFFYSWKSKLCNHFLHVSAVWTQCILQYTWFALELALTVAHIFCCDSFSIICFTIYTDCQKAIVWSDFLSSPPWRALFCVNGTNNPKMC